MIPTKTPVLLASAAAVLALGLGASIAGAAPKAGKSCVVKAAEGTGGDEKSAKFQVDEALLQAVDWGAWASWMANGTTPGYSYGPRTYKCKGGSGLGFTCRGQATICKL
jgi:hypothetical protein